MSRPKSRYGGFKGIIKIELRWTITINNFLLKHYVVLLKLIHFQFSLNVRSCRLVKRCQCVCTDTRFYILWICLQKEYPASSCTRTREVYVWNAFINFFTKMTGRLRWSRNYKADEAKLYSDTTATVLPFKHELFLIHTVKTINVNTIVIPLWSHSVIVTENT